MKTWWSALWRGRPVTVFLLVSSYLFGVAMIGWHVIDGFAYLTSLHILMSTVLLLAADQSVSRSRFWLWAFLCAQLGFWAEYVGVQYEWLFGTYIYGDVLGPKYRAIPVIMGVNWVLVVYAVCATVDYLRSSWPVLAKAALAGISMVLLDLLIEPTAIHLDFWTWASGHPPLQNYIGWLAVGVAQAGLYFWLVRGSNNAVAPLVLGLQVLFFAALGILL